MPYNDLREFIDRLKKTGDLIEINEEVDWNLEAGAIMMSNKPERSWRTIE